MAIFFAVTALLGCGVKGDPLPPEDIPRLGRGYPTYTKASERIRPQKTLPKDEEIKEEKE